MSLRIGVDIDGVVSDSYPVWLQELNRHYGKNITVLEDYEMHLVFDVPWDDMNDFFVRNVEQLFTLPKPMKGAKEGIEKLIQLGHEIIYITARSPEEEEVTLRWFRKHQIPYTNVLFSGLKSKVDLVKQWKIELFVEDYLVNAKLIAESGVPVLLLDATYNKGDLAPGITRCKSWLEIVNSIDFQKDKLKK
ncbi:MAG: hypothetical protein M0T74_10270 [Desulfitobacterium hafniense]|nr:hypothetical protein [Desulfitobacterium hafniense]